MKIFKIGSSIAGVLATIGSISVFFPHPWADWTEYSIPQQVWCVFLILVCLALIVNSIQMIVTQVRYHHCFDFQSKKFNEYFSKWYGKPGRLCIICDDLNWTKDGNDTRIYNQLVQKCASQEGLLLLLGSGFNSQIAKDLENKGAAVRRGPENVISQFSFSCINVMGNQAGEAIVRNKRDDHGNKIKFEEIHDKYIMELLNALINDREAKPADA